MARPIVKLDKADIKVGQLYYIDDALSKMSYCVFRVRIVDVLRHDPKRVRVEFVNRRLRLRDADILVSCLTPYENSGGSNYRIAMGLRDKKPCKKEIQPSKMREQALTGRKRRVMTDMVFKRSRRYDDE